MNHSKPATSAMDLCDELYRADYIGPKLLFAGTAAWEPDGPRQFEVPASRAELLEDFTAQVRALYGVGRNWGTRLHYMSDLLESRHLGTNGHRMRLHIEYDNPWPATAAEGHRNYRSIGIDYNTMYKAPMTLNGGAMLSLAFNADSGSSEPELGRAIHTVALAEVAAAKAVEAARGELMLNRSRRVAGGTERPRECRSEAADTSPQPDPGVAE